MNLDINVAREPFRSFAVFHALAGFLGAIGLVVLVVEIVALGSAFSTRSRVVAETTETVERMSRDRAATAKLSPYLAPNSVKAGATEATTVQSLVSRRAFDWDHLFRELEKVLPPKVKLTAIQPQISERESVVGLEGIAKSLTDQNDLVSKLEASPGFAEVFVTRQAAKDGIIEFSITAKYLGRDAPGAS